MNVNHLDVALTFLYSHKQYCTETELYQHLLAKFKKEEINVPVIISKLLKDGYLESKTFKLTGPVIRYCISFEGILFFEKASNKFKNQSYAYDQRTERNKRRLTVAKTIMTAASTLAIIILTWLSIYSEELSDLKKEVKRLDSTLNSQIQINSEFRTAVIDSLNKKN